MSGRLQFTKAQRAAAIGRADQDLALLSGAGCGKTAVLTQRFAELLRRRLDDPDALGRLVALVISIRRSPD